MKATLLSVVCIGLLSFGLCSTGFAQDQDQRQKPGDTDKAGKTMTVTGCLQKGDQADEYTLKGTDGKMYDLHSTGTNVKLSDHVNHKVTITGKTMTETQKDQNKKGEMDINVTNVKMVSPSC